MPLFQALRRAGATSLQPKLERPVPSGLKGCECRNSQEHAGADARGDDLRDRFLRVAGISRRDLPDRCLSLRCVGLCGCLKSGLQTRLAAAATSQTDVCRSGAWGYVAV
jgi:hypothetical protein